MPHPAVSRLGAAGLALALGTLALPQGAEAQFWKKIGSEVAGHAAQQAIRHEVEAQGADSSGQTAPSAGAPPAAPTAAADLPCAVTNVQPLSVLIGVRQRARLTATARGAAGQILSGRTVVWLSSNPAIVRVRDGELLAGARPGTATVTAVCRGGAPGSATVTVSTTP